MPSRDRSLRALPGDDVSRRAVVAAGLGAAGAVILETRGKSWSQALPLATKAPPQLAESIRIGEHLVTPILLPDIPAQRSTFNTLRAMFSDFDLVLLSSGQEPVDSRGKVRLAPGEEDRRIGVVRAANETGKKLLESHFSGSEEFFVRLANDVMLSGSVAAGLALHPITLRTINRLRKGKPPWSQELSADEEFLAAHQRQARGEMDLVYDDGVLQRYRLNANGRRNMIRSAASFIASLVIPFGAITTGSFGLMRGLNASSVGPKGGVSEVLSRAYEAMALHERLKQSDIRPGSQIALVVDPVRWKGTESAWGLESWLRYPELGRLVEGATRLMPEVVDSKVRERGVRIDADNLPRIREI